MSFIRKRGKYWYYYRSLNGKQYARSLKVRDKKSALELQKDLDVDFAKKMFNLKSVIRRIPIYDAMNDFKKMISLSSYSWQERVFTVLKHFDSFLENRNEYYVEDLNNALIRDYYSFRKDKIKKSTISMELHVLKKFVSFCVENDYLIDDPVNWKYYKDMNYKSENHYPYYTRQQIKFVFSSNSQYVPYYKVLYYTGLRSAMVGNLTSDNIDKKRDLIFIQNNLKHGQPTTIPIHKEISFIKDRKGYIFKDMTTKLGRKRAYEELKKIIIQQNWDRRLNIHSFRHSFNQHLAEMGLDHQTRQVLLGHSSSKSTMDYTHKEIEMTRRYIDQL